LRIWILDRLSNTPHLLKLEEKDWQWKADSAGTSDGVLAINWDNCPVQTPGTNPAEGIPIERLQGGAGPALVAVDASGKGTLVRPGPFVGIEDGSLNVTVTLRLSRQYGVVLTRSAEGDYPLRPELRGLVVVYRNGLRQVPEANYRIENGAVAPIGEWAVDDVVMIDGEEP
jgi:hypothetical protein